MGENEVFEAINVVFGEIAADFVIFGDVVYGYGYLVACSLTTGGGSADFARFERGRRFGHTSPDSIDFLANRGIFREFGGMVDGLTLVNQFLGDGKIGIFSFKIVRRAQNGRIGKNG